MSKVITLSGDNIFELEEALSVYTDDYIDREGDFSIERISAEDIELSRLYDAIHGVPFLANKKLIIIKRLSKNKKLLEDIEHILADVPDSSEVLLVEPKLDKRSAYYKYIKANTDLRTYQVHDSRQLISWLQNYVKTEGGTITSNNTAYLIARLGENQLLLKNEIQKLILFNDQITQQSINELTEATPQSTIFNLLESAFSGNRKQVFALYSEQRKLKVEPAQIVGMLAWQLHILALMKTAGDRSTEQIAQESKLNPYVIRKSQNIARRVTLPKLKQLIGGLIAVDVKIKRTSIDTDDILQAYLLGLVSQFDAENM